MRVRHLVPEDIPKLKALESKDFAWEFGPDMDMCLVLVDDNNEPRAFSGAWKRAECHLLLDSDWETPAVRLAAVRALHFEMNVRLANKGYRMAVTWAGDMRAWGRRLIALGWLRSTETSFHRRIG